jgi:hypothetical protein
MVCFLGNVHRQGQVRVTERFRNLLLHLRQQFGNRRFGPFTDPRVSVSKLDHVRLFGPLSNSVVLLVVRVEIQEVQHGRETLDRFPIPLVHRLFISEVPDVLVPEHNHLLVFVKIVNVVNRTSCCRFDRVFICYWFVICYRFARFTMIALGLCVGERFSTDFARVDRNAFACDYMAVSLGLTHTNMTKLTLKL